MLNELLTSYKIGHWAQNLVEKWEISEPWMNRATIALDLLLLLIISLVVDWIARKAIMYVVHRIIRNTKNEWDDVFYEKRVFNGLAHILPALIIDYSAELILADFESIHTIISKLVAIYIIVILVAVVNRVLKALLHISQQYNYFEGKPVVSFIQLFSIGNYMLGFILILAHLVGRNPLTFIGAFGASAAVLLLIFRDTILGLVASIQVSMNDMVRIGDWISMDKYGADGDVIEINLTTVKVRNWDKTITTVPTYAVVSDSFKNWRGMQAMGVRRIKRSLLIDLKTIKFVDDRLLAKLQKYQLITEYVNERQTEIELYNLSTGADRSEIINGRNMTNVGVFRQYAMNYLLNHPKVAHDEILMVRHLQPTETGLPVEVYCFSRDIVWVNYENIQADIFDHLLAAMKHFELEIYQAPSGADFSRALSKHEA